MSPVLISLSPRRHGAGLHTALALRQHDPDRPLLALQRGSAARPPEGLFDHVHTCANWDALDPDAHVAHIREYLDDGAVYLPSTPSETQWAAETFPDSANVLAPPSRALDAAAGPSSNAASNLPLSIPEWIPASAPVEDLHAFGRAHDWRLWMGTPGGSRRPFEHWSVFDALRHEWPAGRERESLFVQQRIDGNRLLLSFAALEGRLVDAVLAREGTPNSTTFRVEPVSADLYRTIENMIDSMGWSGGGSLHLIDASDGTLWFDRWRPCFGPDVSSLAQQGTNLPAQLLAALDDSSRPPNTSEAAGPRIVSVPQLDGNEIYSSSPHRTPDPAPSAPACYGAVPSGPTPRLDDDLRAIIDDLPDNWSEIETPRSVLLPTRARERFGAFTAAADRIEQAFDVSTARIGLSIKTNPSDRLLDMARESGMLAETIHRDEMIEARRHGYETGEIIVNGPVQALLGDLDTAPYALFGDAVSDLDALPFPPEPSTIGVRTRPPERGPSRFGVDLSDADTMSRLCDRIGTLPDEIRLGLHLHAPASTLGHQRWWSSLSRVLDWADTIQERTGRAIEALDLGGGWHPDDWLDVFIPGLLDRRDAIQQALPALDVLLLEPGKALSQPLGVVVSRVLDVRPHRSEAILDASLAELSNIDYHPHRLLAHTDDRGWHRLPRGNGRLLGRLCMEADILGRDRHVGHLERADTIVICDAGAYDASMTYPFGRGTTHTDELPPIDQ